MIIPGKSEKDPSQAAAMNALLKSVMMTPEQGATAARVPLADFQSLLDGTAHTPLWGLLAERICQAAGPERDQRPPRVVMEPPKQARRQRSAYGHRSVA